MTGAALDPGVLVAAGANHDPGVGPSRGPDQNLARDPGRSRQRELRTTSLAPGASLRKGIDPGTGPDPEIDLDPRAQVATDPSQGPVRETGHDRDLAPDRLKRMTVARDPDLVRTEAMIELQRKT